MRASLLARNSAINAAAQAVGLLAAVAFIPLVIQALGNARFGFLAIAWTAIGYFTFLDFGLGRAATHFVAGALARSEPQRVPRLLWAAALVQGVMGAAGALALFALAAPVARLLTAQDPALLAEATTALRTLALAVPLVLVASSFRGALEAAQRFGVVQAIAVPSGVASLALPLLAVALGYGLPGVVALLIAGRAATVLAYVVACVATFDGLRTRPTLERSALREMVGFGGWVMLSNISIPILSHAERFFIPVYLGVEALAFYTVPHEMIVRLLLLPGALAVTLFPAFSYFGAGDRSRLGELFERPARYLLLMLAPVAALLGVFGDAVLELWVGPEYAAAGALPLRLLSVAFLLNGLAQVPFVAVQGLGRPDLKTKLDAVAVPLFLVLLVLLVPRAGIAGAALAKLILTAVDLGGLVWLASRLGPGLVPRPAALVRPAAAVAALLALALAIRAAVPGVAAQLAAFGALTALYAAAAWRLVVDERDRRTLRSLAGGTRGR